MPVDVLTHQIHKAIHKPRVKYRYLKSNLYSHPCVPCRPASLDSVLQKTFRAAIARLVYKYQRTVSEVRQQILFLLNRLRAADDPAGFGLANAATAAAAAAESVPGFLATCQSLLTTIVTDSSVQLDASTLVDDTFQDALFSQITKTVTSAFAILLAEMDRNGNLRLLALHDASQLALSATANSSASANATSPSASLVSVPSEAESRALSAIWLALFPLYDQLRMMKSDKSQLASQVATVMRKLKSVDVIEDGFGGSRFVAAFPFSFYLAPIVQRMQLSVQAQPADRRISVLNAMMSQVWALNVNQLISWRTDLTNVWLKCLCVLKIHFRHLPHLFVTDLSCRCPPSSRALCRPTCFADTCTTLSQ